MSSSSKSTLLQKRRWRIRKKVNGTAIRPRLCVRFTAKHVYAQAIDDVSGRVLASASDLEETLKTSVNGQPKKARARAIGKAIGEKLLAAKIESVVFDRNGFIYHGRVKEVADGARDAGLKF